MSDKNEFVRSNERIAHDLAIARMVNQDGLSIGAYTKKYRMFYSSILNYLNENPEVDN